MDYIYLKTIIEFSFFTICYLIFLYLCYNYIISYVDFNNINKKVKVFIRKIIK